MLSTSMAGKEAFDEVVVLLFHEGINAPVGIVDGQLHQRARRTDRVADHGVEVNRLAQNCLVPESVVQVDGLVPHQAGLCIGEV